MDKLRIKIAHLFLGIVLLTIGNYTAYAQETEGYLSSDAARDSIRQILLNRKENSILKNSFLQELYIRNAFEVKQDSLFFVINFDLHAADCGAPDCYTTQIAFKIPFDQQVQFPKNLDFSEVEYGCIAGEKQKLEGNFVLVEQTAEAVLYKSIQPNRILLLNGEPHNKADRALYFVDTTTEISLDKLRAYHDFEEQDFPYRSFILETQEYERFLQED